MSSEVARRFSGKRVVVIQGHPDPSGNRLGHALAAAYIAAARDAGHEVTMVDIAKLNFPILRSQQEYDRGPIPADLVDSQTAIFAADHIAVFFPLWLGGMPALLKAYLEQVLRPKPVTGDQKPDFKEFQNRLKGKSVRIVVTLGMPALIFRWIFGGHGIRALSRGILSICGAGPIRQTLFGKVDGVTPQRRQQWIDKMKLLGSLAC